MTQETPCKCAYTIYPLFRLYALWIQSANQPNVECKRSYSSFFSDLIHSTKTYKLTINGEETRISVSKELSKREATLDHQPVTIGKLSISTKDIFANTTDTKTINKNFKLATLSSIASMNDITGYDEIIKSALDGLDTTTIFNRLSGLIDKQQANSVSLAKIAVAHPDKELASLLATHLLFSEQTTACYRLIESLQQQGYDIKTDNRLGDLFKPML